MISIRVLHVVGSSEFGGIAPYIASLVKMVRAQGGDADVLVTAPRVQEYFQRQGIAVVPLEGINREISLIGDLTGLIRLVLFMRRNSYTVVHTHTSKGGIIGRLAARISGIPIIIHTTQGYAFEDYATSKWERWIFLQIERAATRWCDLIIAANIYDRNLAIETGIVSPDKIVTVKNCIDLESIDNALLQDDVYQSLGLMKGKKIIGVMARLSPQKGLPYFIDAIPSVLRSFPSVQILIVGEGDLLLELKEQVKKLGLVNSVFFAGFRSDWIEVLRVMDIFVMPSLWEGLPITLLGAMATRRAIVATRIKGIIDVCGDNETAILVEPSDVDSLATAIKAFLQDEKMVDRFGSNARRKIENEYSEAAMNALIWSYYKNLLFNKNILVNTNER